MDLSAVRAGLATRLATIPGLQVQQRHTGTITSPCAVIAPDTILPGETFEGSKTTTFRVFLFVQMSDPVAAQTALDAYLSDGASSVFTALDGDVHLSGSVYSFHCVQATYDGISEVGGVDYLAASVECEVYTV